MTVKKIVKYGTPSLREKSKEVHKISKKVQILVEDLYDTMYAANGVGLAAPQIGENLRVFVIDVGTDPKTMNPITFINPKIIKKEGAINSYEGCLSFPDAYTNVRRYKSVKVKALNIKGKPFVMEINDGSLLARAIQHEFDHLDGILFIDHVINRFEAEEELSKHNLPPIQVEKILEEPELTEQVNELKAKQIEKEKKDENSGN